MSEKKVSLPHFAAGAIFIVLGALFLLKNLDIIDVSISRYLFSFPSLLIFIGLVSLVNARSKILGLVLVLIGLLWHFARATGTFDFGDFIVPLALVGLGFYLILKQRTAAKIIDESIHGTKNISRDRVEDIAIFGGGNKIIVSDNFQGGTLTSIFGGSEIDLTRCELALGDNVIDILAIFGGSTLIVPSNWNVIVEVLPIFGGYSRKTKNDINNPSDKNKTLIVKGLVIFGGGEIKNY